MRKANGQTTTCPKENADLLVESFASIFTREKALNENCVLENMAEQINEFTVEREEVIQQLNSLNIHEAAGLDSLHPMIIKTLAENEKNGQRRYSSLSCCRNYMLQPQPMEGRNSHCLTQERST